MTNIEICPKTTVKDAKEELLTNNLNSNILKKEEYLLKAIIDFSLRYNKDNRNILKNKKFLVTFDDLMTLIKDTINSQNKINNLDISQTEKLKDVSQDFINNLSYIIFSFEKIEISENKNNLNTSVKINKKNSFNALNPKNNLISNKKTNNNRVFQNDENTNLENLRNILCKKNKSSRNLIMVNSNKKQNNNNTNFQKNIISINTLSNRIANKTKSPYPNFSSSSINKPKPGQRNNRYEIPILTENNNNNNLISNTLDNLIIDNQNNNNRENSNINSAIAIPIPPKRAMTPKKLIKNKTRENSTKKLDKNIIKSTEKQKKSINKNPNCLTKNICQVKNNNINNIKKNSQKAMGSFIDNIGYCRNSIDLTYKDNNNQLKNEKILDLKLSDGENLSTYTEFPKLKEKKNHKETVVYEKNNEGGMRILYKELVDMGPKPSHMANKILEENRKYINEFNAMKSEKRKEKKKK